MESVEGVEQPIMQEFVPKLSGGGGKAARKRFPPGRKAQGANNMPLGRPAPQHANRKPFKRPEKLRQMRRSPSPDGVPIDAERLARHDAGAALLDPENARTKVTQDRLEKRKKRFVERIEKTARAELLNEYEPGCIVAEPGASTAVLRQSDICEVVDVASATKRFDLVLDQFGPYRVRYTHNGRHLLLGGRRGHIAAFDWMTKELKNETNVMETVRDVQWLHVETMFAVAQKRYLRIYDNQGTELHCMKQMFDIIRLEFLPRHMLLVAGAQDGFLHYLDVCTGELVRSFRTKRGPNDVMAQNAANAIILTGSERGVVSMWSPNSTEPLVEIFSHRGGVRGLSVDDSGNYMATSGLDKRMKIFDIRTFKELHSYSTPIAYQHIAFSQQRQLAAAGGGVVDVFKDAHLGNLNRPYLKHSCGSIVTDLRFCPYEDVLGVGHENGFSSLLIPGAGDPNFDPLRANPFESTKQRREREVRMLLDKLQPEMITLNPSDINKINPKQLDQTQEYREKVMKIKPVDIKRNRRTKAEISAKTEIKAE